MAIDTYLYKPLDEELIERIENTKGVNMGEFGSRMFSIVTRLYTENVPSAQLIFGKDINIPFGRQFQGPDEGDGTNHLDYLVGLVVDGPNTHKKGYREEVEKLMLDHLEIGKDVLEYLGIYSGDRAKALSKNYYSKN